MEHESALVAIIDDEEPIRKALVRLLRLTSYRAAAFASALEFLESLAETTPDCVVLDLHMPDMTGVELLRRLSSLSSPPPVIVITADDGQDTQDECMRLGTRYYFHKPVDGTTLVDSVRKLVTTRS